MPKLSVAEVCDLLHPYLEVEAPRSICEKVQRYVALLELWNKKLNLTAVREPEEMVRRHFGESFYFARVLPQFDTLLDVGSGAGFPGLPISMLRPAADIVLAESQLRKAAFLREAAWMVGSRARVWAHRVEEMEAGRRFQVVVLRAVDNMREALEHAFARLQPGGTLAFLIPGGGVDNLPEAKWNSVQTYDVPFSAGRILVAKLAGGAASAPGFSVGTGF